MAACKDLLFKCINFFSKFNNLLLKYVKGLRSLYKKRNPKASSSFSRAFLNKASTLVDENISIMLFYIYLAF